MRISSPNVVRQSPSIWARLRLTSPDGSVGWYVGRNKRLAKSSITYTHPCALGDPRLEPGLNLEERSLQVWVMTPKVGRAAKTARCRVVRDTVEGYRGACLYDCLELQVYQFQTTRLERRRWSRRAVRSAADWS